LGVGEGSKVRYSQICSLARICLQIKAAVVSYSEHVSGAEIGEERVESGERERSGEREVVERERSCELAKWPLKIRSTDGSVLTFKSY